MVTTNKTVNITCNYNIDLKLYDSYIFVGHEVRNDV